MFNDNFQITLYKTAAQIVNDIHKYQCTLPYKRFTSTIECKFTRLDLRNVSYKNGYLSYRSFRLFNNN